MTFFPSTHNDIRGDLLAFYNIFLNLNTFWVIIHCFPLILSHYYNGKRSQIVVRELVPLTEGNVIFSGDVMDRAVHAPYDVTRN